MERAAILIRQARERSGLSQRVLAHNAGVQQSVISAYETGAREPSLRMLDRLVTAAGAQLRITLDGLSPLREAVHIHRGEILRIANEYGIDNVQLFGSVARGDDDSTSDIDLLVTLGPGVTLLDLIGFEDDMRELLQFPVDVVPDSALKSGYSEVLNQAQPL